MGGADTELNTVAQVKNTLGIHEYLGHGIKGYVDKTHDHYKAYELQMNHSTWNKWTETYRKSTIEKYNKYLNPKR